MKLIVKTNKMNKFELIKKQPRKLRAVFLCKNNLIWLGDEDCLRLVVPPRSGQASHPRVFVKEKSQANACLLSLAPGLRS